MQRCIAYYIWYSSPMYILSDPTSKIFFKSQVPVFLSSVCVNHHASNVRDITYSECPRDSAASNIRASYGIFFSPVKFSLVWEWGFFVLQPKKSGVLGRISCLTKSRRLFFNHTSTLGARKGYEDFGIGRNRLNERSLPTRSMDPKLRSKWSL